MIILNKLKYDKVNILAKCSTDQTYQPDMLYNATHNDRAINGNMIRFINFWFNPKPLGDEETYSYILNRLTEKNNYMRELKIKSLEVNFDYSTELGFDRLEMLGKIITDVLAKRGYKTLNINADIVGFDYSVDEFNNRFRSFKWYKYKSKKAKHRQLEVKLYRKAEGINRFEIIFHNNDNRLFKTIEESSISSGARIKSTFKQVYDDIIEVLELDKDLWNNEGIADFMNAYCLVLGDIEETEEVA